MVVDLTEGGAEVESRAPGDLARSSPVAGGARGQPIVLSEGSVEAAAATAQGGKSPEVPTAEAAGPRRRAATAPNDRGGEPVGRAICPCLGSQRR